MLILALSAIFICVVACLSIIVIVITAAKGRLHLFIVHSIMRLWEYGIQCTSCWATRIESHAGSAHPVRQLQKLQNPKMQPENGPMESATFKNIHHPKMRFRPILQTGDTSYPLNHPMAGF